MHGSEAYFVIGEGLLSEANQDGAAPATLGPDTTTFRMSDLLLFACEGKKAVLAPLG